MKKNKIFLLILFSLTSLFQNAQPMIPTAVFATEAVLVMSEVAVAEGLVDIAVAVLLPLYGHTICQIFDEFDQLPQNFERGKTEQLRNDRFSTFPLNSNTIPKKELFNPDNFNFIDSFRKNFFQSLVGDLELGVRIPEEAQAIANIDKLAVVHVDTHGQVKSVEAKNISIPLETIKTLENTKVEFATFTKELLQIQQKKLDRIAYEQKTQLNYQRVKAFQNQALFEITKHKVSPEYAMRRELAAREEAIREMAQSLRCSDALRRDFLYVDLGFFDKVFLVHQAPHLLEQHSAIRKRLISNPAILASEYLFAVTENWPERTTFHEKINSIARQRKKTLRSAINTVVKSVFILNHKNIPAIDRLRSLIKLKNLTIPQCTANYAEHCQALADLNETIQKILSHSPGPLNLRGNPHVLRATAQFLARTSSDPQIAEITFNKLVRQDRELIKHIKTCSGCENATDFYYAQAGPLQYSWLTFWKNNRAVPKNMGPYFSNEKFTDIEKIISFVEQGYLEKADGYIEARDYPNHFAQAHHGILKWLKRTLIEEKAIETASCISVVEQPTLPCGTADHLPKDPDIPLCDIPENPTIDTGECLQDLDSMPDVDLCGTDTQVTSPEDLGECNFSKGSQDLPSLDDSTQTEKPSQVQDESPSASSEIGGTLTDIAEGVEEILSEPTIPAIESEVAAGEDIIDIGLTAQEKTETIEKILKNAELETADYLERIKELKDNSAIAEQYKAKPIEAYQAYIKNIEDSAITQAIEIQNRPEIISKPKKVDINTPIEITQEYAEKKAIEAMPIVENTFNNIILPSNKNISGEYYDLGNGERFRDIVPTEKKSLNPENIKWAEGKYQQIRNIKNDIKKIAENTGLSEKIIDKIKNHVFLEEHITHNGLSKFDADPAVIGTWDRLTQGDYIENDISFLKHEFAESMLMEETNIYKPFHDALEIIGIKYNIPPQYED